MQGAPKRQVNAEEMLAELKRALEASALAPPVQPPSRLTTSKSISSGRAPPYLQRPTRPGWRSWKLIAGGLALAGAAAICAGLVFMDQAAPPKRALSFAPAEALVKAQNEFAREPSGAARAPMRQSPQAKPSQASELAARPAVGAAPGQNGPVPAREAADLDAPNLASFGLESPPPIFAPSPLDEPAALAPAERIGPDGAPIAAAHAPAPTGSAPQAETPKKAAASEASPLVSPEAAKVAAAPPTPASTGAAPQAETPAPKATGAPLPPVSPEAAKVAAPPPTPASTGAAPQTETPAPNATAAPSPPVRPEAAKVEAAPPTPASTDAARRAETPKAKAARAEDASNESQRRSTPRTESRRKPPERRSLQRLARSAKASAKPAAQAERRSTEPARPKEAERAPGPAQGAGAPAAVAPAAAPTVPQRLASGVTHAFGYLIHLPGALVSHPADPNADAH